MAMEVEGEHNGNPSPSPNPTPALEVLEANNKVSLIEGNTSFFNTFFNGSNAIIGNSVVLVPYALASGGWLSLIVLLAISIFAIYGGLLIQRCMEADPRIKQYSDIGEYAFGKIGKVVVSIVLYADLYMATTGFLILEGDNLHKLFPRVAIHALGFSIDGKSSFIIIIAVILLPTVLLDNLSIFAYISATGCLASVLVLGSILWVGAFDGVGFGQAQTASLLNWKGIPTAISLYMLCYTSHPIFPTLYTSMQKKHNFFKAILLSFVFCSFIYASMAISGYLMFGPKVESQITLSLPKDKVGSKIAIYITVIAPLVKYALLLKPVVITTECWFPSKYMKYKVFKIVIKVVLVVTQVIVALALPYFGYLMALSGALLGATGSLIIPCSCYLKISSKTKTNQKLVERICIWVVICSGIVILVSGTYTSSVDIVHEIMHS